MKKEIIIFGTGKIAEVIYYYAINECAYTVAAFTTDSKYITEPLFQERPVIAFEELEKEYAPAKYDMFVAVGYHDMNQLREKKCNEALQKGYKLVSIISPMANVPSNVINGYNCFVMSPAIIHPCVELGNNVFVWSGAMVGHHSKIGDNVWLTSCSNIGGNVNAGNNSFFAVNATVGHSVNIGKDCFLGANTLVTKELLDGQVVISESNKPIKLNSKQFLRLSSFSSL
jgi:sugar O-acyltransferase (sialic acid O-acetyltransferase NeuD family)